METANNLIINRMLFLKSRKAIMLIILSGIALRLGFFAVIKPWQDDFINKKIIMVDSGAYHSFALSILNTRSFSHTGTYRTPGYPLFLALVYFLFGARPWVVIFLQIFIGAATIGLVYLWTKEWFNEGTALFAALLYAIEPHVIVYGGCLLTETLFVFILLLSVLAWHKGFKTGRTALLAGSALFAGYLALIKPIAMLLPVILVPLSFVYNSAAIRYKLKANLLFLVIFFITMSAWMCKNYAQYGHYSLTHINGYNLLFVSAAFTEVARTGKTYLEVCKEFDAIARAKGAYDTTDLFKQSDIYTKIGLEYLNDNRTGYIKRHATGMVTLFTNLASTDAIDLLGLKGMQKKYNVYEFHNFIGMVSWYFKNKTLNEIIFGSLVSVFLICTYVLAVLGVWASFQNRLFSVIIVNLSIAFYFCFLTGVFGVARYRLPLIPFYILFSAYGFYWLKQRINVKYAGRDSL